MLFPWHRSSLPIWQRPTAQPGVTMVGKWPRCASGATGAQRGDMAAGLSTLAQARDAGASPWAARCCYRGAASAGLAVATWCARSCWLLSRGLTDRGHQPRIEAAQIHKFCAYQGNRVTPRLVAQIESSLLSRGSSGFSLEPASAAWGRQRAVGWWRAGEWLVRRAGARGVIRPRWSQSRSPVALPGPSYWPPCWPGGRRPAGRRRWRC